MTKAPQLDPVALARDAGARSSGWHRLGDGPWYGTVLDDNGVEWEVEQLTTSWSATSSTSVRHAAPGLPQLLKKICG